MTASTLTALAAVTVACVAANAFIVVADLSRARFVLANSAEVGLKPTTLPYRAALKGAGSAGLVIGLIGVTQLGLAAALGLVMFYVGAVGAHLRASVLHTIGFPLVFLVLATGSTIYFALVMASWP
ncbi:transmembrane invasion protein [Aeromicrobium sp. PE09-221]|uniref:DoxX family protein n=1 Tax=Aeromicrobium sp. PE09-221 TaxID=1898043 RepID=UPI000B3ED4DD|nr:DoxX family protein [Aeromicrobium sp. PE09-221]OUZ11111.1 transmembrane invasion protein [Aeromicrobium sp. PE09-221]